MPPKKLSLYHAAFYILIIASALAAKPAPPKEPDYPPFVLLGTGKLVCNISAKEKGRQTLTLGAGSGVSFDVVVTPIVDGVLELKKNKGMNYRFTSKLVKAEGFTVTGFGPATLVNMDTRVSINTNAYQQPDGPGTSVSFASADMDRKGLYVEFRGVFKQNDTGKKFAFRTLLGPAAEGNGKIVPQDSNDTSRIVAKTVTMDVHPAEGVPYTQIVTTIREL